MNEKIYLQELLNELSFILECKRILNTNPFFTEEQKNKLYYLLLSSVEEAYKNTQRSIFIEKNMEIEKKRHDERNSRPASEESLTRQHEV